MDEFLLIVLFSSHQAEERLKMEWIRLCKKMGKGAEIPAHNLAVRNSSHNLARRTQLLLQTQLSWMGSSPTPPITGGEPLRSFSPWLLLT